MAAHAPGEELPVVQDSQRVSGAEGDLRDPRSESLDRNRNRDELGAGKGAPCQGAGDVAGRQSTPLGARARLTCLPPVSALPRRPSSDLREAREVVRQLETAG